MSCKYSVSQGVDIFRLLSRHFDCVTRHGWDGLGEFFRSLAEQEVTPPQLVSVTADMA